MAVTRPDVPGVANKPDAPTQFDPRPSSWPVAEHHVMTHDFGQPEVVRPEDGPGSA
jgi:hypothetical protein